MKKIIFFILLFIANYTYSQVKVSASGGIIPTGIYPAVDGNDVKGSVHEVQSIIDRDNIPANFRRLGMLAYVVDSLKYYQLKTGLTNSDWYELRWPDTTHVELPLYVDTANGVRTLKILHDDGLVSGGIVTKGVADWDLDVTNAVYYIGHKAYSSSSSTVTIDTADADYDRIDLIGVDTTGNVFVITGTPSATPIAPQVNPSSQLTLTTITVKAASTLAPIITKIIYDEGAEWDTATSGTIIASFGNEDNPYHDTKDVFVRTYENGGALEFTDSGIDTATSNMVLKYFLYLNSEFTNSFQVQFFNDSNPVSNSLSFNSGFGLNPNNVNVYQNISIPFTSFIFSSNIFNKVKITMAGEDLSGAAGYYLDYIQLQKGVSQTGSGSCPLCIVDIHVTADSTQQIGIRQNGDTAFVINWTGGGGSGGGITLYNGNGSLTSDRLVHLDGKKLLISNIDDPEQNAFLSIDPTLGNENSYLASVDENGFAVVSFESNVSSGYNFELAISDGTNESGIYGKANNNEIEYNSGVHRFTSNLDSAKVVIQDAPIMSTTPTYIAAFDGDTLKKAINSGGGINSIVAGDNIDVDNTDPSNPVVSAVLNGITTASNGLTKVGNDVQLGGTLKTGNTFIYGQSDISSALFFINVKGFNIASKGTDPLGETGDYTGSLSSGGGLGTISSVFSSTSGGQSSSYIQARLNNVIIRATSGIAPYNDPLNFGSSLNVFPDGVYIISNTGRGIPDSGTVVTSKFNVVVDSSDIPNADNIAYFDDDNNLKRGHLETGGGSTTFEQSLQFQGETVFSTDNTVDFGSTSFTENFFDGEGNTLSIQKNSSQIDTYVGNADKYGDIAITADGIQSVASSSDDSKQAGINLIADSDSSYVATYSIADGEGHRIDINPSVINIYPVNRPDLNLKIDGLDSSNAAPNNIAWFDGNNILHRGAIFIDSTVTLTSGTITVSDTRVKTGARIFLTCNTPSGTQGFLSAPVADIIDGTSFVINSSSSGDNSTVNYIIINP